MSRPGPKAPVTKFLVRPATQGHRLFELDRTAIKRSSHDDAFHAVRFERDQTANINQCGHAAGSDGRNLDRAREFKRLIDVDSITGAVAADVGINNSRSAVGFAALCQFYGI